MKTLLLLIGIFLCTAAKAQDTIVISSGTVAVDTTIKTLPKSIMYRTHQDTFMWYAGFYLNRGGKRLTRSIYMPIVGSILTYAGAYLYNNNPNNPLPGVSLIAIGTAFNIAGIVNLIGAPLDFKRGGKALQVAAIKHL